MGAGAAEDIGFAAGRSVVRVEGVRWNEFETEQPICYVEIFFDSLYNMISPRIGTSDLPIADLIEDQYQVRIERIRQEVSASRLLPATAAMLGAEDGAPSLVIKRWYFDNNDRMFEMTRSQYPADRFRYVVNFGRSSDAAPPHHHRDET